MSTLYLIMQYVALMALFATPLVGFWAKGRFGISWLRVFIIASLVAYVLIILTALVADWHADAVLQSYDLNGDGMFTDGEITAAQQQAMLHATSDTGRSLAPFTGLVFAPVGVLLGFLGLGLLRAVWRLLVRHNNGPNRHFSC